MDLNKTKSIYDKNYTALSIERVTEIDSTIAKKTIIKSEHSALSVQKEKPIESKSTTELLSEIQKDTYYLLMNSSPLLGYQAVSTGTYNLYETKLNLLKQYKNIDERIEKKKRSYLETIDVTKKK